MKYLIKIALIVLLLSVTLFAKDVARVTGLSGDAFIQRDGTKIEVTLGMALEEKDTITTDSRAKVQIIFEDETIISLGKNSKFSIKEYFFEETKEPVAKFAMLKGAMRTITGKIGKVAPEKFSVEAKTATIGIRGTNFSVLVGDDESVQVFCTFGAISVNVNGAESVVNQGFYIIISPDGGVEIKEFTPQDLKEMKEQNFAKGESKKGDALQDAIATNETQLDNTREEFDNIVIKDITDSVVDAEQTAGTIATNLSDLIAGYSMSDALYTGTYSVTQTVGLGTNLQTSGVAELMVDFGADTVNLSIDGGVVFFDEATQFNGSSFSVNENSIDSGVGSASGTFKGATGNIVEGNFFHLNGSNGEKGIYNVTTEQELH
ncbi:MAG: FecR domain-containing protein [Sulfurimonas sp.]|uniref:FecR family protein n=1 Tax=Sulfurimonas sp. TaxID=2022749 RepID=UPI0025F7DD53|nr:FecR family protein [Sulfurimonas sp.]MCK9490888.1 FecR domain-containing protein [Sulfurimonas sp.]